GSLPSLNERDALAIQNQLDGIAAVSPELSPGFTQVVAGAQNWNTRIIADYPSIFAIQSWEIAAGSFFDEQDEADAGLVCDIGQIIADNLFPGEDPIGQTIRIRNVPFKVKGVLRSKGSNGSTDRD